MESGNVSLNLLLELCEYCTGTQQDFYSQLWNILSQLRYDAVISLLTVDEPSLKSIEKLFEATENDKSPKSISQLLYALYLAKLSSTFHKINVHAAMTPSEIKKQLDPVFLQANFLWNTHKKTDQCKEASYTATVQEVPFVTVRYSIITIIHL